MFNRLFILALLFSSYSAFACNYNFQQCPTSNEIIKLSLDSSKSEVTMRELLNDLGSVKASVARLKNTAGVNGEAKESLQVVSDALGLLGKVIDERGIQPRGEQLPESIKMAMLDLINKEGELSANDLIELTRLIQEVKSR